MWRAQLSVLGLALACATAHAQTPAAPAAAAATAAAPASAASAARRVAFVACPIYRNTARSCWSAESGGKSYYIGRFGIRSRPQLLHQVLIEGDAKDGESSCGTTVIDNLRVSVLTELSPECDSVLPDNGAAPSELSLFDRGPEALSAIGTSQPVPPPLTANAVRRIEFDFNNLWLNLLSQRDVEAVAKLIVASKASLVRVTGQSGSVRLDDGRVLVERAALAQQRAQAVAKALTGLGVDAQTVKLQWRDSPLPAEGRNDAANRDVVIEITVNP